MDEQQLNDELLESAEPESEPEPPKRNTKQALIDKILELSSKENIPLQISNTKLKRMNKQQLAELCGDLIEQGMKKRMAESVGVDRECADDRTIALGALRMLHDVCAMGVEKGSNSFLEPRGYTVNGFCEGLKEPTVSLQVDQCLQEIADENTEILEYVKSPYTRLMLCWGGALALNCRPCKKRKTNVADLESGRSRKQGSLRSRRGGRPANGKEHVDLPPPATVKEV